MKKLLFLIALFSQFAYAQIRLSPKTANSIPVTVGTGSGQINFSFNIGTPTATVNTNGNFNFAVNAGNVRASAGVYNSSGVLVRTLFSAKTVTAGPNTAQWDGYLDDGITVAPVGDYTVRVLSNNLVATHKGGIGSTSGGTINGFGQITGLCFTNGKAYYGDFFAEGGQTVHYINLSDINTSHAILPGFSSTMIGNCTDGLKVYSIAEDQYASPFRNFIIAANVSDDSNFSFSSGTNITAGRGGTLSVSAIGNFQDGTNAATNGYDGIAVQKNGNFLFATRPQTNDLLVFDKSSGVILQTLKTSGGTKITVTSDDKYLWLQANNVLNTPAVYTSTVAYNDGYNAAKAFDGNFTTTFASVNNINNEFVEVDYGQQIRSSFVKVAARIGYENRLVNAVIQGSNDNAVWDNLYTITSAPLSNGYSQYPITTSSYRYWRIFKVDCSVTGLDVAELDFNSSENIISQYNINSDGTLTASGLSLPGGNIGFSISPASGELAIADDATCQIKFYNGSTGALNATLGRLNGYFGSPAVDNTKFLFHDEKTFASTPVVNFQPDGSFWVRDAGTYRWVHYNADKSYKEYFMYLPSSRSCNIDANDNTKFFSDELEFKVDNNKPLDNGTNGSWKLINCWKPNTSLDEYHKFTRIVTLSNGHTYAQGDANLYDLTTNGAVYLGQVYGIIEADGSLWNRGFPNEQAVVTKQPLTGFDGNNKPVWGASVTIATTPPVTPTSPFYYKNNTIGSSTNPDRYFFYNPIHHNKDLGDHNTDFGVGYHLGAIKTGGNTFDWQASKSTYFDYHGDFPRNGDFDIGNNDYNLQHSENCVVLVNGPYIVWHVNAEFWGANSGSTGVNIFNLVYQDGLPLLTFGKTNLESNVAGEKTWIAINSFSNAWTKIADGFRLIYCDEAAWGETRVVDITGLSSVREQNIPVSITAPVTVTPDPSDMMAGVPFLSSSFFSGYGWTANPSAGINNAPENPYPTWRIRTSVDKYTKEDKDIYIVSDGNANGTYRTFSRNLGVNASTLIETPINSNNWKVSGFISLNSNLNGNYSWNIIDANGKVLIEIGTQNNGFLINGSIYYELQQDANVLRYKKPVPFIVENINGQVSVTLNSYLPKVISSFESTGDFNKPKFFTIYAGGSGDQQHTLMSVSGLRFITGSSVAAP